MTARRVTLGEVFCQNCHEGDAGGLRVWEFSYAPHQVIPHHEHASPYVCFLIGGDIIERDRRDEIAYARDRLAYLPAGCAHNGRIGPEGARAIGFELGADFFSDDLQASDMPDLPTIIRDRRLFRMLHYMTFSTRTGVAAADAATWPYEIVATLTRERASRADKGESWLRQVIDYIHAHAADNPSPADLAAIAGRHPTHMMRAFKKQTGTTIGSYIQAVKVDLACQLMRSSARSLTDIASTCGFADQSHFIRTFRAAMGVAPSVYRKALL